MDKKVLCVLIATGCLLGVTSLYVSKESRAFSPEGYCAFCDREVVNRQKFYEDDLVFALLTHKPILPGHCLIIPKRHVERFEKLTDEEITHMGRVIKKVHQVASKVFHTSSYLLLQKNGVEVGQSVPHVHFHYIPRQKGDDSTLKFLAKMYSTSFQKPLSAEEIQRIAKEMTKAMLALENSSS